MTALEAAAAALVGWLLLERLRSEREGDTMTHAPSETQQRMRALITAEAHAQGVPPTVALAFAFVESGLDPTAEGDLQWPYRKPDAYRRAVLENERFQLNPWRTDPSRWHSYGLFQLLAPYHVLPDEDPRELLRPTTNAARGVARIARLLDEHGGDPYAARLHYIGCGRDGTRCSEETRALARVRLRQALARFEHA